VEPDITEAEIQAAEGEVNRLYLGHEGFVVDTYRSQKKKKDLVCVRVNELGGVADFHIDRVVPYNSEAKHIGGSPNYGKGPRRKRSRNPPKEAWEKDGGIGDRIAIDILLEATRTIEFMTELLSRSSGLLEGKSNTILSKVNLLRNAISRYDIQKSNEANSEIEQNVRHQEAKPNDRLLEVNPAPKEPSADLPSFQPEQYSSEKDKDEKRLSSKEGKLSGEIISKESCDLIHQQTSVIVAILRRAFLLTKENSEGNAEEVKALLNALGAQHRSSFYSLIHQVNPGHRLLIQKLTGEVHDLRDDDWTKSLDRAIFRLLKDTKFTSTARMYTDNELKAALKAWCNKRGSQEEIKICFGVPRQTLRHHHSMLLKFATENGVSLPSRKELPNPDLLEELLNAYVSTLKPRGGQRILTEEEEKFIANKLDLAGKLNGGLSARDVRVHVKSVVDTLSQYDEELSPRTRNRLSKFKASRGFGQQFISRNKIKSTKRRKTKLSPWLRNPVATTNNTTKEIVEGLKKQKRLVEPNLPQAQQEEPHPEQIYRQF